MLRVYMSKISINEQPTQQKIQIPGHQTHSQGIFTNEDPLSPEQSNIVQNNVFQTDISNEQ